MLCSTQQTEQGRALVMNLDPAWIQKGENFYCFLYCCTA